MRVAIPVFRDRISPRFDFTPEFGLYDIEGETVTGSSHISCEGWNECERASRLKGFGVATVICGGLPRYLHDILIDSGITVIPWVAGDVRDALSLFIRGELNTGSVISSDIRRQHGKISRRNE